MATAAGGERRVTVVELDDDYYAQIWIDAPDRLQLRQAMNVAEHLAFR